jgi:type IV pilus assembly protein PilW
LIVTPAAQSDILVVRAARQGQPVFRTDAGTTDPTAVVTVDRGATESITTPQTLVIGDCEYATVFQATGFVGAGGKATIAHAAGGVAGENVDDSILSNFLVDSLVMPIDTVIYYVGPVNSPADMRPGLWQQVGGAAAQLLIPGVENMQVRYGVDDNADLRVDQYVTADAVTKWANVITVNLAILVRSEDETGVDVDDATYNLLGTIIDPVDDRRLRSVFTTTITLRSNAS